MAGPAARPARPTGLASSTSAGHHAGLRRPEARPRARLDADPTDEVKADQKAFFRLLYNLLVDADRGPRLPTLIVALGADKVRSLLTA